MKKTKFLTQTILYKTVLFGKEYYWMQDIDGTIYLTTITERGTPELGL